MKDVIVTTVRIPRDAYELVLRVTQSRAETVSGFIRRAVLKELASLSYLPKSTKKALGVAVVATEA